MTKQEAKQILNYLDNISGKRTTRAQFDEMSKIMSIIEKEIER